MVFIIGPALISSPVIASVFWGILSITAIGLEFPAVWHCLWSGVQMVPSAFLECIPCCASCEVPSKLALTSEAVCDGAIDVFTPLTADQPDACSECRCLPDVTCLGDWDESA